MSERAFHLFLAAVLIVGLGYILGFRDRAARNDYAIRFERLKDWKDVKDEIVVEIEQPQRLQILGGMRAQPRPSSSYSIPMRDLALNLTLVTDYECPWCKEADSAVNRLANKYGVGIVRSIIHFPLQIHKQAIPAARALECAYDEGVAHEMNSVLFSNQDSLGLISWGRIAEQARVEDTTAFKRCIESAKFDKRIEAGKAFAKRHNIAGTPALIVNGTLVYPVDAKRITQIVDSISGPTPRRTGVNRARKISSR